MAFLAHVFAAAGLEPVPAQLFSQQTIYRWEPAAGTEPCMDFAFTPGSMDRIRWRDIPRLWRGLARTRPAVVYVNGWRTRNAVALHLWCKAMKIPTVLVSDSTSFDNVRRWWKDAVKSMIVRTSDTAFVAGTPHRRYVEELGMPVERIFTGCDVVDNAHFAPAQALRKSTGCRVLTVARLVPEKNLLAAASAFIRFAASRAAAEKWVWTIVGYGPQQERLKRAAETAGGKIELRGYVSYDRMPEVYGAADLYWQPSVSEPWGLVVNEAMASGLPVLVSTQCGCAQDLVSPEVGWTFDPTSDDGLIDGLRRAAGARSAWREMGATALKRIADWDLDRFAQGALLAAQAALAHAKSANAHR